MADATSYFVRTGEHAFQPTQLVSGAWNEAEQHISPMNGLVLHELERWLEARGDDHRAISRISVDILGVLDLTTCEVHIETIRGGRAVELLEVSVANAGRTAVRTRIWRTATGDTSTVAGGELPPLPAPETSPPSDMTSTWPGGYIASLDVREAVPSQPGRATAWVRSSTPVVADEPSSDLASFIALVDTANGTSLRESPDRWLFPNLDLTIHLLRQPRGPWVGLDSTKIIGADGYGMTSTNLFDTHGHVGHAEQTLLVRPR